MKDLKLFITKSIDYRAVELTEQFRILELIYLLLKTQETKNNYLDILTKVEKYELFESIDFIYNDGMMYSYYLDNILHGTSEDGDYLKYLTLKCLFNNFESSVNHIDAKAYKTCDYKVESFTPGLEEKILKYLDDTFNNYFGIDNLNYEDVWCTVEVSIIKTDELKNYSHDELNSLGFSVINSDGTDYLCLFEYYDSESDYGDLIWIPNVINHLANKEKLEDTHSDIDLFYKLNYECYCETYLNDFPNVLKIYSTSSEVMF